MAVEPQSVLDGFLLQIIETDTYEPRELTFGSYMCRKFLITIDTLRAPSMKYLYMFPFYKDNMLNDYWGTLDSYNCFPTLSEQYYTGAYKIATGAWDKWTGADQTPRLFINMDKSITTNAQAEKIDATHYACWFPCATQFYSDGTTNQFYKDITESQLMLFYLGDSVDVTLYREPMNYMLDDIPLKASIGYRLIKMSTPPVTLTPTTIVKRVPPNFGSEGKFDFLFSFPFYAVELHVNGIILDILNNVKPLALKEVEYLDGLYYYRFMPTFALESILPSFWTIFDCGYKFITDPTCPDSPDNAPFSTDEIFFRCYHGQDATTELTTYTDIYITRRHGVNFIKANYGFIIDLITRAYS